MPRLSENETFIIFVVMSIISICIGIWIIYNLRQFLKYKSTFVFKQRYPILVQWICNLIIFNMFIRTPLLYFMISKEVYTSNNAYITMTIIEGFLYSFTMHAAIWLNLIRFVHAHFNKSICIFCILHITMTKPKYKIQHGQILVDILSISI